MTSNPKDDREALARLAATLTEDLLRASDDELIAELLEDGRNPTDEANAMRAVIERAARACGKTRLAAAKTQIAAERQRPTHITAPLDPGEVRRKLAALLSQNAERSLLVAARYGTHLSDDDIAGMLADFEELGVAPDKEHPGSDS